MSDLGPGKYAIKAITERGSERVIRHSFELARQRNNKRKVTVTCKYNMLSTADGLFLKPQSMSPDYPDITFEHFIVDDFLCRMIARPQIWMSLLRPIFMATFCRWCRRHDRRPRISAPGCYGEDYAYFESAHGTAPDIAGQNIINPTATMLSAAMMLDYLDLQDGATRLRNAVTEVYAAAQTLPVDQGGKPQPQSSARR
ncbi:MAG: hypothetical protein CM15mP120_19360 [Pseudomonadota bacterium]|nr:MAG: hypothetical protein CM15mP120_19360 [Pseudomonadota bacterium]